MLSATCSNTRSLNKPHICPLKSLKMTNYLEKIIELQQPHVHIKDKERVNSIIEELVLKGPQKLQVVSDFDRTITKQHEDGKEHASSFGMFSKCPSVTEEYKQKELDLTNKYRPIEVDPTIPLKEKYGLMEEWWRGSEKALRGEIVGPNEIDEVCKDLAPSIRDGTKEFFQLLNKSSVPVLVFSAGLGDTVMPVLKHAQVLLPNVKVISNFLKYDETGKIEGFQGPIIHVYNKNELALQDSDSNFFSSVKGRHNVILLGDSLGDARMADGISDSSNVLKIGFLYERKEEALPSYMDTFDIVLEDDQTMTVAKAILQCILEAV